MIKVIINNNNDNNNNNNNNNVLWDINVQCDNVIEVRRPDIIVIDKKERKGIIIDIVVPADVRKGGKQRKKLEKYFDICYELPNRRKHGNDNSQNMTIKLNNNNNDTTQRFYLPVGVTDYKTCSSAIESKTRAVRQELQKILLTYFKTRNEMPASPTKLAGQRLLLVSFKPNVM